MQPTLQTLNDLEKSRLRVISGDLRLRGKATEERRLLTSGEQQQNNRDDQIDNMSRFDLQGLILFTNMILSGLMTVCRIPTSFRVSKANNSYRDKTRV